MFPNTIGVEILSLILIQGDLNDLQLLGLDLKKFRGGLSISDFVGEILCLKMWVLHLEGLSELGF